MSRKEQRKTMRKKSALGEFLQYIIIIGVTLCVSFAIQRYIFASVSISGSSMAPTLQNGENMFMYRLGDVQRFDVVVLNSPDYALDQNGQRKVYIKRVIGMPGDTLEYKNDTLYINGEAYQEDYLNTTRQSLAGKALMADRTLEKILADVRLRYPNLPEENTTLAKQNGKKVIPEGYYFVLGDNRLNSHDGDDFGLASGKMLQGVAVMRWWPFTKIGISPFK